MNLLIAGIIFLVIIAFIATGSFFLARLIIGLGGDDVDLGCNNNVLDLTDFTNPGSSLDMFSPNNLLSGPLSPASPTSLLNPANPASAVSIMNNNH